MGILQYHRRVVKRRRRANQFWFQEGEEIEATGAALDFSFQAGQGDIQNRRPTVRWTVYETAALPLSYAGM
jgi:hypothetical protein